MLDPNEIIKLSERSEIVAAELQEEIVKDICERIALRLGRGDDYILTARDKWQLEVLKDAGYLVDDLIKIIAKKTGVTVKEMRKAFAEAGVSSTKFDDLTYERAGLPVIPIQQSPAMIRLLERGMNKTFSEWKNYTGTTVRAAYDLYVKECDRAYNNVLSGHMTYGEAVKIALDAASSKGGVVEYPSGHRDTLETATYRAVRTGISQACSDVTSVRAAENGITLFITSSHLGARPTHEPWQGKVFWVDWDLLSAALGITYENPNTASINEKAKYDEFVKTTEIGTVTGLCGANCRHSYGPYIEGISHNPYTQFDSEENRKRYEAEQTQRSFERRIRKQRRKVEGLKAGLKEMDPSVSEETEKKLRVEERKLARLRKEYKQFSDENGLKERPNRLEIAPQQSEPAAQSFTEHASVSKEAYNSVDHFPQNAVPQGKGGSLTAQDFISNDIFDKDGYWRAVRETIDAIEDPHIRELYQKAQSSTELFEANINNGYLVGTRFVYINPDDDAILNMDVNVFGFHELTHWLERNVYPIESAKSYFKAYSKCVVDDNAIALYNEYVQAGGDKTGSISGLFVALSKGTLGINEGFLTGHDPVDLAKPFGSEREALCLVRSLYMADYKEDISFIRKVFPDLLSEVIGYFDR